MKRFRIRIEVPRDAFVAVGLLHDGVARGFRRTRGLLGVIVRFVFATTEQVLIVCLRAGRVALILHAVDPGLVLLLIVLLVSHRLHGRSNVTWKSDRLSVNQLPRPEKKPGHSSI